MHRSISSRAPYCGSSTDSYTARLTATRPARWRTRQGGGRITLSNGIVIEVRPSGWENVNGTIGYDNVAIPHASIVERLGVTEREAKVVTQAAQATTKISRENNRELHESL